MQVQGFASQHSERWETESEYKTVKKHFLPTVRSMDCRLSAL